MGKWGHGLFDDDLAADVKGHFDGLVAGGTPAADAAAGLMKSELAREILEEFGEGERDEMFWEESGGLFFAVASLQLEHGVLQADVRKQTLEAIAQWRAFAGDDAAQIAELDNLETRLKAAD